MAVFLGRRDKGPDPWVEWKVRIFFVGAVLGLVGMATGWSWLVFSGIAVLVGGFALRFIPASGDAGPDE